MASNKFAWIDVISEAEAGDELAEVYAANAEPSGGVDNIIKIHSLNVPSMHAHLSLYKTIMYGKSPIRRPEREMIATVVSSLNHCRY